MQRILSEMQTSEFHHDQFVERQLSDFEHLALPRYQLGGCLVDVGGGCGIFAKEFSIRFGHQTRVLDRDLKSINIALKSGVNASLGDALNPEIFDSDVMVCFNLMLHHLVGNSSADTAALQIRALAVWNKSGVDVFVNEYIYESWFFEFSSWLIYFITRNRFLSFFGEVISNFIPTLRANTFGVGVRFRSNSDWKLIFDRAGYSVVGEIRGDEERISLARRFLFIKSIRRDSFILTPKHRVCA